MFFITSFLYALSPQLKSFNFTPEVLRAAQLNSFEGKGLTVEQKNGKVYVSMENKLLFQSGSWAVGTNGKEAVKQLGSVLADNPEIAILIEGHTDNVGNETSNIKLSKSIFFSKKNRSFKNGL